MYRHVLCVYPHRKENSRSVNWPPLGIELIAATLAPHAEKIDVIDLQFEKGHTVDFIRPDTDLVCFSVNWDCEQEFVRDEIRSVPPELLTVIGGRQATQDPERWLADCPNVDIVVRGDGEEIIADVARGLPCAEVQGISYRDNGSVIHNQARECGPVRDDVRPDRKLRRYVYGLNPKGYSGAIPVDTIVSSRGCPFNCRFCSFNRNPWGGKRPWSGRSPESVVDEIAQMDARIVGFMDDNFTHDMDRVERICDLLIERGIKKRYFVNARVEVSRRPEVLEKMRRAGFFVLLLGIESAQDKTLHSMQKGFNREKLAEHFRVLRRSGMLLHGYFIVGNIGETEAEMLEIAPFARGLGLDTIRLNLLRNERYSGLDELVAESPGYHIDADGKIYSDDLPISSLRVISRKISRRFYSPLKIARLVARGIRSGLLTPGILVKLPGFLVRQALSRRRRKKKQRSAEAAGAERPAGAPGGS